MDITKAASLRLRIIKLRLQYNGKMQVSLNYYQILLNQGKTEAVALKILAARSRDNSRTSMQWNTEQNCGFSRAGPWLSVSAAFRNEITVELQQKEEDSILAFYKKLIAMRKKYPVIAKGSIAFLDSDCDKVLAYKRFYEGKELTVICNLVQEKQKIEKENEWTNERVLLGNYKEREINQEENLILEPYEILVIGSKETLDYYEGIASAKARM